MRYFPSASRRRALPRPLRALGVLTAALVLAFMAASTTLVPAAFSDPTDDLKDKQRDVRSQVKAAQDEVAESSSRVAKAAAAYRASKANLAEARADLHIVRERLYAARALDSQMRQRLVLAQERLVQAEAELEAGRVAMAEQQEIVKDLVVSLYQQGDPTLVSLSGFMGAQSPSDLIRHEDYADTATAKQGGIFDELTAAEVLLQVRQGEVEDARDAVAERRAKAAENLAAMEDLTQRTIKAKDRVEEAVAGNLANQQRAREARQHDLKMLRDLKREEAKIKKQIAAAIAAAAQGPGYVGSSNGFLDYPVAGRVTSPYGYRVHPIYGYYGLHDGIDFGVGCGSAMRAVSSGTVVARYYSSVYGNRLYLSLGKVNGHNLVAVYNHASSYRVGVGQKVSRGETVGYVGSTGWSTGCHLHFSVMEDGNAVDPMKYL